MDKTIQLQAQIRQNADEVSNYLSDMLKWEKEIERKDKNMKKKVNNQNTKKINSIRDGGGTVVSFEDKGLSIPQDKSNSASKHTYDVGYQKWEKFNVEEALNQADLDLLPNSDLVGEKALKSIENDVSRLNLTPANIISKLPQNIDKNSVKVPRALGVANKGDSELQERERGNEYFKNGEFNSAVKSYTKCIGLKVRNYIAFSNRSMAYLKLKEYTRAENDASCALSICPDHVKSLMRRSGARAALGKYRAALNDLIIAESHDPSNKAVKSELLKTKELLRQAVSRAPMVSVEINGMLDEGVGDGYGDGNSSLDPIQGPELPF